MPRFASRWRPYVPVATRRRQAAKEAQRLANAGKELSPVRITGRAIATTFWGKAWCENLENYCDWENRMPRGRTYVRNGSVIDLQVEKGKLTALVSGSSIYKIKVEISSLKRKAWKALRATCAAKVSSILDLMRGKLSDDVIERLTDPVDGMFPKPREIKVSCSCPDYAVMCKHVAAALYGVGHLLDESPELFFLLRGVDQTELVSDAISKQSTEDALGLKEQSTLGNADLEAIFGIQLATTDNSPTKSTTSKHRTPRKSASSKKRDKSNARNEIKKRPKKKLARPKASPVGTAQSGSKAAGVNRATPKSTRQRVTGTATKTVKKKTVKKKTAKKVATKKKVAIDRDR